MSLSKDVGEGMEEQVNDTEARCFLPCTMNVITEHKRRSRTASF